MHPSYLANIHVRKTDGYYTMVVDTSDLYRLVMYHVPKQYAAYAECVRVAPVVETALSRYFLAYMDLDSHYAPMPAIVADPNVPLHLCLVQVSSGAVAIDLSTMKILEPTLHKETK